jgi:hypothetical protein
LNDDSYSTNLTKNAISRVVELKLEKLAALES